MAWPTMSDYQDALQSPNLSFSDYELRKGVSATDRLGLPKPVTGGFASVYQVNCSGRKWAVRCFLRYHQDMEERYASIGKCLQEARLPYTAGFQFLRNGVRIRGQWYPALKMEWVDGEPLNSYVERVRKDRDALLRLDDQFTRMARDLRRCNIAHGDLQHGNIMVVGESLKLVDYDGMFVPQLRGMPSHEVGHPNYQHPRRNDRDFGPYLDNFSEWVIHLSIVALSIEPGIWDLAINGDEQLLFSRRDFADPRSSQVLRALDESSSTALRQMAAAFRSVLSCQDIQRIPPPDGARPALSPAQAYRVPQISAAPAASRPEAGGSWIVVGPDAPGQSTHPSSGGGATNGSLPDWVLDHIGASQVELAPPFRFERASAVFSLVLAAVLARFSVVGYLSQAVALWGSVAGFAAAAASIVLRYRGREEYIRKASLSLQISGAKREIRRIEGALRSIDRERIHLTQRGNRSIDNLTARISDLDAGEQSETKEVDNWLSSALGGIASKRNGLYRAEAEELAKAAQSTPSLLLKKRAQLIMGLYRARREPIDRHESKVKIDAVHRKEGIRIKYARKKDPLKQKLAEAKTQFDAGRADLDGRYEYESQQLTLQKWTLQNLSRELTLYSKVNFATFAKKVFYLKR